MKHLLNTPHKTLWLFIPFVLGLLLISSKSTFDIQLHDTYFVISFIQAGLLFVIFFGISGGIYWSLRTRKLINWMTIIHLISTILTVLAILIIGLFFKESAESDFETLKTLNQLTSTFLLIGVASQLLFLCNVMISLIRNESI